MKNSRKIVAFAVAGLMATSPLLTSISANAAPAAKSNDAVAKMSNSIKNNSILKTDDEAFRSLREIRASRLAIFNGDVVQAKKFAVAAMKDMTAAQAGAKKTMVPTKKSSNGDNYIPFDVSITLADDFVITPEKKSKIKQANGHLAKGEEKKAVEVLKLTNIDVVVSAALIPVNASVSHLQSAINLISKKKYYEANLAMKAIVDGIVIESYGIDDVPYQGEKN